MVRYYALAQGYVQGVGFRYFITQTAHLFSLTGWVRNRDDGAVDLEVQGSSEAVDSFLAAIRMGSHYSEVDELSVHPLDPIEEREFRVLNG